MIFIFYVYCALLLFIIIYLYNYVNEGRCTIVLVLYTCVSSRQVCIVSCCWRDKDAKLMIVWNFKGDFRRKPGSALFYWAVITKSTFQPPSVLFYLVPRESLRQAGSAARFQIKDLKYHRVGHTMWIQLSLNRYVTVLATTWNFFV